MLEPENLCEILGEGLAEVETRGRFARSISILSCCSVIPPSVKLPSSEAVVIGTSSVVVVGERCFNLKHTWTWGDKVRCNRLTYFLVKTGKISKKPQFLQRLIPIECWHPGVGLILGPFSCMVIRMIKWQQRNSLFYLAKKGAICGGNLFVRLLLPAFYKIARIT